jgi:hypothetical protein
VAGRFRSTEKSNELRGKRTRDHPAYNIVPQPTTPPRVPTLLATSLNLFKLEVSATEKRGRNNAQVGLQATAGPTQTST